MIFKDAIQEIPGFRQLAERLVLRSTLGRRLLYELPFSVDEATLQTSYDRTEAVINAIGTGTFQKSSVAFGLHQLKDIRTTLMFLQEGYRLGDIELFEIKELALLSMKVYGEMDEKGLSVVEKVDLSGVFALLDPENTGLAQFYIYDAYSPELGKIRNRLREEPRLDAVEELRDREAEVEDLVREKLTAELKKRQDDLLRALLSLGELDILLGKAEFAVRHQLVKPLLSASATAYNGLRNLEVEAALKERSLEFQPVTIAIRPQSTVITGGNMAGKSVLLQSIALAQTLAQLGFYVPATRAEIVPVEQIYFCKGDDTDTQAGLSSFAAEILKINEMIRAVQTGKKILALLDEPARSTNPAEGLALVNAIASFLSENKVPAVIATHYSGITASCRRLRVKGFIEDKIAVPLSLHTINRFMDYSVAEETEEAVPHEALRIAEILGLDPGVLEQAHHYLRKE